MYYYIVNPAAGSGTINSIQDRLKANLRSLKIDGEFAKTLGPGDATTITEKALDRGVRTIVVVGGSETINEVITAINRQQRSGVAVGIIPTGKHNHLARSLGIGNWRQACEILASRRLFEYSLVAVNEHVFVERLVLQPPSPAEVEDEQANKGWQKWLARPAPELAEMAFRATLDKKLKLRGESTRIEVYNQKFLNPALDNKLLLRIEGTPVGKSGLAALAAWAKRGPDAPTYSTLHAEQCQLRSQKLIEADFDGKTVTSKLFDIALTDWKLKLITNLERVSEN